MNPPPIPDPHSNLPFQPAPVTGDGTGGVIPFKNPSALAAYYIGLFSLIPVLCFVMAPLAVVLGVKGLKYAKQFPVVKGQVHAWVGIVCGAFWTLIYYGFGLLALIAALSANR